MSYKDYIVDDLTLLGNPHNNKYSTTIQNIITNPTQYIGKEICDKSEYVSLAQMNSLGTKFSESCVPCGNLPIASPLKMYLGANPYSTKPTKGDPNSADNNVWESLRSPDELGRMCHPSPHIYIPSHYDANPFKAHRIIDWKNIVPINSNQDRDLYSKWFNDRFRLDTGQTNDLFHYHMKAGDMPKNITSPTQFRKSISEGRGSEVQCTPIPSGITIGSPVTCDGNNFGPANIIYEEYNEWKHENDSRKTDDDLTGLKDFSMFSQYLGPTNTEFENCMNDIFRDTGEIDFTMTQEIRQLGHFRDWEDKHIQHIKRKFGAFIINKNHKQIMDCMGQLHIPICNGTLPEQMATVLGIMMYIIGYDLNINDVKTDNDRDKLIYIIDELGDLVPRVLEKIIEITESQETQKCGGVRSTTRVLRELHTKVFTSGLNVVNFDLGLSELVSDAGDKQFNRSTILAVLGIAFLKYF